MSYEVTLLATARKELLRLPKELQARIMPHLEELAAEPYPENSRKLLGEFRGLVRLRVGSYRVAYQVDEQAQEIIIVKIGHRGRFYQAL